MKNKAFILDFNLLEENNISNEEFLALIYLNNGGGTTKEILESLQEKQFIKLENFDFIIREKGKLLLELCEIESINSTSNKKSIKKSSRAINLELDNFIKDFRLLWKGKKPGSMGSEKAVRDKMYRWMQENPSYSKDDIMKAAKLYLDDLNNNVYLQQADYFIYKKDIHGESSRLSAFIDEIDLKPVSDWTSSLS